MTKSQDASVMTIEAFRHLTDNIHDFRTTAMLVESEIRRLGLSCNGKDVVDGTNGRLHGDMWASMKTASHFNIEIALELTFKLILRMNEIAVPTGHMGHRLCHLFDVMPASCQQNLEDIYREFRKAPEELVGMASVNFPVPPILPPVDLSNLSGFLEYLDDYVRLWEKRYSWELVDKGDWRHYLLDISVLVQLVDDVLGDSRKYF